MKENHISNDKFSQEAIFQYWVGSLSGHVHVNQAGKQHDALKKTTDKTLENTFKTSINTKLPTCDYSVTLVCLV
jgi:hypothetical protein